MRTIHVLPLRDVVEHDVPGGLDGHDDDPGPWLLLEAGTDEALHDLECVCKPRTELVTGPHPDGWLVVHHSLDGREARE